MKSMFAVGNTSSFAGTYLLLPPWKLRDLGGYTHFIVRRKNRVCAGGNPLLQGATCRLHAPAHTFFSLGYTPISDMERLFCTGVTCGILIQNIIVIECSVTFTQRGHYEPTGGAQKKFKHGNCGAPRPPGGPPSLPTLARYTLQNQCS